MLVLVFASVLYPKVTPLLLSQKIAQSQQAAHDASRFTLRAERKTLDDQDDKNLRTEASRIKITI
jgi:hypothetical protein